MDKLTTVLIDKKVVSLSEGERELFHDLLREFGIGAFENVITTDEKNHIININPLTNTKLPWGVLWFLMGVSIQQRLRDVDKFAERIGKIEEALGIK